MKLAWCRASIPAPVYTALGSLFCHLPLSHGLVCVPSLRFDLEVMSCKPPGLPSCCLLKESSGYLAAQIAFTRVPKEVNPAACPQQG